jgi:cell wall-associated NlpC family hydrolase
MYRFNRKAVYLSLCVLLFLTACSTPEHFSGMSDKYPLTEAEALTFNLLVNEYRNWQGTPYRLGGTTKAGVDCSGFVQAVYKNSFNISIARNTDKQAISGRFVQRNALQVGDLVFFKSRWKARHVGIYLGDDQFLHASSSKGVMISSLNNVYWQPRYWQSRRILY